eukprot:TRINITY_DN3624_c0_g1_i2.p1 TRINITY_DN3624_c0_g1~~TRINITY_DN3624_c0_g1_i2.p1  ORF type:complete len:856 (+),score=194.87 TRINITY_DN3624_c0_g1_i2:71-2638(+)
MADAHLREVLTRKQLLQQDLLDALRENKCTSMEMLSELPLEGEELESDNKKKNQDKKNLLVATLKRGKSGIERMALEGAIRLARSEVARAAPMLLRLTQLIHDSKPLQEAISKEVDAGKADTTIAEENEKKFAEILEKYEEFGVTFKPPSGSVSNKEAKEQLDRIISIAEMTVNTPDICVEYTPYFLLDVNDIGRGVVACIPSGSGSALRLSRSRAFVVGRDIVLKAPTSGWTMKTFSSRDTYSFDSMYSTMQMFGYSLAMSASVSVGGFFGSGMGAVGISAQYGQSRQSTEETKASASGSKTVCEEGRMIFSPQRELSFSVSDMSLAPSAVDYIQREFVEYVYKNGDENSPKTNLASADFSKRAVWFLETYGSHVFTRYVLGGVFTQNARSTAESKEDEFYARAAAAMAVDASVSAQASYRGFGKFKAEAGGSYNEGKSDTSQDSVELRGKSWSVERTTYIYGGNLSEHSFASWSATLGANSSWRVIDRSDPVAIWELVANMLRDHDLIKKYSTMAKDIAKQIELVWILKFYESTVSSEKDAIQQLQKKAVGDEFDQLVFALECEGSNAANNLLLGIEPSRMLEERASLTICSKHEADPFSGSHIFFRFERADSERVCYHIVNVGSGMFLDVPAAKDGAEVYQSKKRLDESQQWAIHKLSKNSVRIMNMRSGRYLDTHAVAPGGVIKVSAKLHDDFGPSQKFILRLFPTELGRFHDKMVYMQVEHSKKYLTMEVEEKNAPVLVQKKQKIGDTFQQWRFYWNKDNSAYHIISVGSNKAIEAGDKKEDTYRSASIDEESQLQMFRGFYSKNGLIKFKNLKTGWVMDVHHSDQDDGTELVQWIDNDTPNQQFHMLLA